MVKANHEGSYKYSVLVLELMTATSNWARDAAMKHEPPAIIAITTA